MRVLLIKMSSMGDVFHTFPALTDAQRLVPDLEVHWIVEEAYSDIPGWHPAVSKVIPIGWRRWQRSLSKRDTQHEARNFFKLLRQTHYDVVLDAQGLMKSAIVARLAKGKRYGLDSKSVKEPLASFAYAHKLSVPKGSHAVTRLRDLFAQCLGYSLDDETISYGLDVSEWQYPEYQQPYVVFLHGTTWDSKQWPETNWKQLSQIASNNGYGVLIPWGNQIEKQRAERIAEKSDRAEVLPALGLSETARILKHARAVIGVDTGLSHVAAALDVPTIAIYGSTDPSLTGVLGPRVQVMQSTFDCAPCITRTCPLINGQLYLVPPCYDEITPTDVWRYAIKLI